MHKTPRIVGRVARIFTSLAMLAVALGVSGPLLTSAAASAPAYVDHTTPDVSTAPRNSATVSHTVSAGDNRLLLVAVMIRANEWVSSVTYGGTSLTPAKVQDGGASDNQRVELWYLAGASVGTADVVVTFGSYVNPSAIVAVNLTEVDQNDPIGATAGASASSGTQATTSITTLNADSLILGAVSARSPSTSPFGPGGSITEEWDTNTGSHATDDDGLWGGRLAAATATAYTFNASFLVYNQNSREPRDSTPLTLKLYLSIPKRILLRQIVLLHQYLKR